MSQLIQPKIFKDEQSDDNDNDDDDGDVKEEYLNPTEFWTSLIYCIIFNSFWKIKIFYKSIILFFIFFFYSFYLQASGKVN